MTIEFGFMPQVFLLVLIRVAAIIGMVIFFGRGITPPAIQIAACFMVALVITPAVPPEWIVAARNVRSLPGLAATVAGEIMLGAAVGLVCNIMLSICAIGGKIISMQSALAMASEVNPTSGLSNPLLSNLLQNVMILIFVLNNGHLVLLRLMGESFHAVPPDGAAATRMSAENVLVLGRWMYESGIKLATPVLGAAMIVNICFGLMARLAPDFNIMFLALPIRLLVGLFAFTIVLRFGSPLMNRLIEQTLAACAGVLTG